MADVRLTALVCDLKSFHGVASAQFRKRNNGSTASPVFHNTGINIGIAEYELALYVCDVNTNMQRRDGPLVEPTRTGGDRIETQVTKSRYAWCSCRHGWRCCRDARPEDCLCTAGKGTGESALNLLGIGIDWGTSNVRAWALGASGATLGEARRAASLSHLEASDFEPIIAELIGELGQPGDTPVVACGMIGAKGGWFEAPYLHTPILPDEFSDSLVPAPRNRTWLVPGLTTADGRPEVMRGEETQLLGALAADRRDYSGTMCLPGTHSKWVTVAGGKILKLRTFVTGELFELAAGKSVFGAFAQKQTFDEAAFQLGLRDSKEREISSYLFQARTRVLANEMTSGEAYWYLSGLILGEELHCTTESQAEPLLIADGELMRVYCAGMKTIGAEPTVLSSIEATKRGLFGMLKVVLASIA